MRVYGSPTRLGRKDATTERLRKDKYGLEDVMPADMLGWDGGE